MHPAIPDRRPHPFVGPERRDHGNQSTHSRFDESISVRHFPAVSSPLHLFTFLILPIHFSSCGNSFFHLTLYFPSRYLYIVADVHSQNANLAFSAPNQGDSCPLNCAIFFLSPTKNSKSSISKPKSSARIAPRFIKFRKTASNISATKSASRPSPSFSATSKAASTCSITTRNSSSSPGTISPSTAPPSAASPLSGKATSGSASIGARSTGLPPP